MTIGIGKMTVIERLELRSLFEWPDFTDPLVRLDPATSLPCRTYQGERLKGGYGRIRFRGRKVSAHRAAYEEVVAPIPAGHHVDHLCRNPPCWEPSHLEAVTVSENVLRGVSGIWGDSCSKGHPFDAENTYMHGGHQYCRACRAENHERRKRKSIVATPESQKEVTP